MPAVAMNPRLEEVVTDYYGPLTRFFQRRLRPGQEADDLVQEVFGRLARQDLATIENIQGYVFQIAANVLRDQARRSNVRSIIVSAPADMDVEDEAGFSPERVLQSREAVRAMVQALYELPTAVRMVFSHYHFDGVAQVEIARRMGLSLSTVEKHMTKANTHLLYRLRDVL
jgi:RNA polymerase sigma factor (sigma-70 family)